MGVSFLSLPLRLATDGTTFQGQLIHLLPSNDNKRRQETVWFFNYDPCLTIRSKVLGKLHQETEWGIQDVLEIEMGKNEVDREGLELLF